MAKLTKLLVNEWFAMQRVFFAEVADSLVPESCQLRAFINLLIYDFPHLSDSYDDPVWEIVKQMDKSEEEAFKACLEATFDSLRVVYDDDAYRWVEDSCNAWQAGITGDIKKQLFTLPSEQEHLRQVSIMARAWLDSISTGIQYTIGPDEITSAFLQHINLGCNISLKPDDAVLFHGIEEIVWELPDDLR